MSGSMPGNTTRMLRLILTSTGHGPFILDGPEYRCRRIPMSSEDAACSFDLVRRRQMRNNKTNAFRSMMAVLIGLAGLLCLATGETRAEDAKPPLALQFTFDRPMEASMAPF